MSRFWSKVIITSSGCWGWQASKDKDGYGRYVSRGHEIKAHRYMYLIQNGEFDRNLLVCHRCDNPGCVNPKHLFLGTQQANMRDKVSKGRQLSGSANGASKLTEEQVVRIREEYPRKSQYVLAKRFNVSRSLIGQIVTNKVWRKI